MYEQIPSELKAEKAWVNVWNNSKIPMRSTVKKAASSTQPESWSTFEEAVKAVEDNIYDGIGYVFHDTGLIGIDIDTGFKDMFLSPIASDIINRCVSYTEKSRSGRGFHILVKGTLPFHGRNNHNGVEIYKSRRYFIMTGRRMFFPHIRENQEAIDYILETYFPDALKESSEVKTSRIYSPVYKSPAPGKLCLKPEYPEIKPGARNISLTSLAGQLHTQGYSKQDIYKELLYANSVACKPPLDRNEVEQIVNSVTRYRRA